VSDDDGADASEAAGGQGSEAGKRLGCGLLDISLELGFGLRDVWQVGEGSRQLVELLVHFVGWVRGGHGVGCGAGCYVLGAVCGVRCRRNEEVDGLELESRLERW
jgi:hypothetical protein